MSFWSRNIDTGGRLARGVAGVALLAGAAALGWQGFGAPAAALGIGGAFCLFEAARGWCLLRACKVRTPL